MPIRRRQAAPAAGVPLYPEIIEAMHTVTGNSIASGAGNAPGTSAVDVSVLHVFPKTTVDYPPTPPTPAAQNGTNTLYILMNRSFCAPMPYFTNE